jgi:hypothetical protein
VPKKCWAKTILLIQNWHISTSNFDVQGRTLSSANDALIIIIAVIEVVVLVLETSCIKYSRS